MTRHLIIGGGPAATNAIETIREFDDGDSQITLVCNEPAHSRMALPYWLAGKITREHTYTGDEAYFTRLNVDARIGRRATGLDTAARQITLDDGTALEFDTLLLATGSKPLIPPIDGTDLPGVLPLWTLSQTGELLQAAEGIERPRVVMIGAGFVGFLVLGAMFKRGWQLTVVEREAQVLPRMLDGTAAEMVSAWLDHRQVAVHTSSNVQAIRPGKNGSKQVVLADGQTIVADLVILATGVQANLDLVADTDLDVDQGILVDAQLQTSVAGIYAAGDVAQGPVRFGRQRQVHAIQPTAVDHGRVAGANMAGADIAYPGSLLMNVVDVCGLQSASFGDWNDLAAEAMTVSNSAGSVYRKLLWTEDRITGAIFIGRANDMGMLTDVGMVKGIIQSETPLDKWKDHLRENPFDVRRAYIGAGVPAELAKTTLLGRPAKSRSYRFQQATVGVPESESHNVLVNAWQSG